MTNYERGFMSKCAEYGFSEEDSKKLLQLTLSMEKDASFSGWGRGLMKKLITRPFQKATGKLATKAEGLSTRLAKSTRSKILSNPAYTKAKARSDRILGLRGKVESQMDKTLAELSSVKRRLNPTEAFHTPAHGWGGTGDYADDLLNYISPAERTGLQSSMQNLTAKNNALQNRYWALTRLGSPEWKTMQNIERSTADSVSRRQNMLRHLANNA